MEKKLIVEQLAVVSGISNVLTTFISAVINSIDRLEKRIEKLEEFNRN